MINNNKKIFFFFPYYHTGGAEKVHLQVVKCFSENQCVVFFTDRSRDKKNKKEFKENARCFNFFGIGNKVVFIEKLFVILLSYYINKKDNSVVFGSNSRFFYSLAPKLKNNIKVIDLVHWLDGEMGKIIIKNSGEVDKRIVVTKAILPVLEKEYRAEKIDSGLMSKVKVIENCVSIPPKPKKNFHDKLKILYIGRNTDEKRPWLAVSVWEKLKNNKNFDFIFIGRGLKKIIPNHIEVIELIEKEEEMNKVYKDAHIIILTSIFEGFPCVIMEAMSQAVAPITTAVGGLPVHLKNNQNALLVENNSEDEIVNNIVKYLLLLDQDRSLLEKLSANVYEYAKQNFSCNNFKDNYRNLINDL
jgi:glycosyltransferase involved in cell wall biosynthesis